LLDAKLLKLITKTLKGIKLCLFQEWQHVCLWWKWLGVSYCGQLLGSSGLHLGKLVKVVCTKLVTAAMLGPNIRFTTTQALSRCG
jgi:hypothetical protein